jgi:hypothetical protein
MSRRLVACSIGIAVESIDETMTRFGPATNRRSPTVVVASGDPLTAFGDLFLTELTRFCSATHFIGNVLIDVAGDSATAESCVVAFLRMPPETGKPACDPITCLRCAHQFAWTTAGWRISARTCALDWSRADLIDHRLELPASFTLGQPFPADVIYKWQ